MLKHQLIHPKISEVLARAGHHAKVLIADGNYPAGGLKVTIQLATAKQTVDFGPIVVLDRGK